MMEIMKRVQILRSLVESVNDAPFFAMDMHQVVGLDLDFHMEIHYGDVDTDYEELELTLLSGPAWTHSLDGNHLFGMPKILDTIQSHFS